MKMNSLRPALLTAILGVGAYAGAATSAAVEAPPQVSMTRSMLVFADLEKNLDRAIASHDQPATDALLSTDFEYRPDMHPGDPTTRADWLADAAMRGSGTDQLSVRDFGDVAVVSFVMTTGTGTSSFVVDVWKQQGDNWQLITRYQSALPATETPTEDKAPTGKG